MEPQHTSRNRFAIIDETRQLVVVTTLVAGKGLLGFSELRREVAFDQIASVYLDFVEDSYMAPDKDQGEYGGGEHRQIKRTWTVGVQLIDGETVILYDEVADQPARELSSADIPKSYWQSLAARLAMTMQKPLLPVAPAPSGPGTFIEAIDHVLQRRLERSPLAGRVVHVRGTRFGVNIVVDGNAYPSLDELPDPDVRSAIQAAIEEWQRLNP